MVDASVIDSPNKPVRRSTALTYGVAVLAALAGIALPLAMKPITGQSAPWVSFVPAVLFSAWYGGFVPGLFTAGILVTVTFTFSDLFFVNTVSPASRNFAGAIFVPVAVAICYTIRAMRLAQARAQAERDRVEAILRVLPVGVVIANDSRVELANPAAQEMFGAEIKAGSTPPAGALRGNRTVVNEETDLVDPEGRTRSVIVNARSLESVAIATYSDVTSLRAAQEALKTSEARLRRLFDSPLIGIVSGQGDVALDANDGYLRMLGYTREDLEKGALNTESISPQEFRSVDARAERQLATQGFSAPVSREFQAKDGSRVPVMVGAASLEDGHWIAWVLDLTEHRKLEERLRQAAKAESIGLLAGGVAHDFNNLLTIIMGNVNLAQTGLPESSRGRTALENALRAGERAADLTRQLLAYAGKGHFIVRPGDVSEAVRAISSLFRSTAPRAVDFRIELASDLPPVSMDATQIQQLAMNLAINAVESIGDVPGFVHVTTSVARLSEEDIETMGLGADLAPGPHVCLEVTDNGCGMDAETRQRIFDPFFTTKFAGRGLGLAAAAGIVKAHHGGVVVTSAPGQGSTFQVFLPVFLQVPEADAADLNPAAAVVH